MEKQAFNPYLPSYEYIPDGEPHVFDGRVQNLLQKVAAAHPDTPVYCTDVPPSISYNTAPETVGAFCRIVRQRTEEMGGNFRYIPGINAFRGNAMLSTARIHPSSLGHTMLAEYFYRAIRETE